VHAGVPERTPDDRFYYVGVMRRGDAAPDWVRRLAGGQGR
jgi:hypothetical protein